MRNKWRKMKLENKFDEKEYARIKEIKTKFEKTEITLEEISDEDAYIISKMYDYQIKNLNAEIKDLYEKIDSYKKRMQYAIDALNKN